MTVITGLETYDVRFPTSRELDGSDAMNPDPDYSAAYVVLQTDLAGLCGHGFVFTIGRRRGSMCKYECRVHIWVPLLASGDSVEAI
jgi:hypothetical protein